MAYDVVLRQAKVRDEVLELGDEQGVVPELDAGVGLVAQVRRAATADLLVEDDGDAVRGGEVEEGRVRGRADARPAVQDDERGRRRRRREVAGDLVPGPQGLARGGVVEVGFTFVCCGGHCSILGSGEYRLACGQAAFIQRQEFEFELGGCGLPRVCVWALVVFSEPARAAALQTCMSGTVKAKESSAFRPYRKIYQRSNINCCGATMGDAPTAPITGNIAVNSCSGCIWQSHSDINFAETQQFASFLNTTEPKLI